jgi:hypothetical protein
VRKQHWAILFALIVLSGGTLWLLLSRAPIEEGRCRLVRKKADPSGQLVTLATQMLQPTAAQPDSVQDLPPGFDRPSYYLIKSADRRIPLVVNMSERPSLCLDTNGDGVLSQERCFAATRVRETKVNSSSLRFGPISFVSEGGSGGTDSGFYVDCYRVDPPAPLTTRPAFFRTGRLRLDGRTYRVAVVDGDCDGRFQSILSLPLDRAWRIPESDVFAIDLNGNGQFEISLYGRSELMPLGHLVQVGDAYYAIDIASDGMSLAFSKIEPQFGTLIIEPNDTTAELKLWSDAADQYLRGRQWQLPAGKYKGIYAAFEKKDASGDVWSFSSGLSSAFSHLGSLDFFVIEPGETTSIKVGPPFVIMTEVQRVGAGLVSIGLVLTGCGGEQYQADFQRNYRRAPERAFKIVDEKGTVLVADKFQYG